MNTPIQDLKTKGFVVLDYPKNLRDAVEQAIGSWQKFCEIPLETKQALPYSDNFEGIGYEYKDGIGNGADYKENFDVTIAGQEWLKTHTKEIQNPHAINFVEDASKLVELIKPIVLDFATQAEQTFKLPGLIKEVENSEHTFFVRFIHYFGNRELEDQTATPHIDHGGFTLHLFESDPGLQRLTQDKKWIDMPVSDGETVIIPGLQMQLLSENELKALCHRVIATEKTMHDGRYSAVCFISLNNTLKYDKAKHGRLQERVPGFNYDLSLPELEEFFKK